VVLDGATCWFDHMLDALIAEAMAAKEGLELVLENGYDKVILEDGSSALKSMVDSHVGMKSSVGRICFVIA